MRHSIYKKPVKLLPGLIISSLVTLIIVLLFISNILKRVELNAYDIRFRLRGEREITAPVNIVAIDDDSLSNIGRWPWTRNYHAYMIQVLNQAKVEAIMFNILFMEPSVEEHDTALMRATWQAKNVYHASYFRMEKLKSTFKGCIPATNALELPFDAINNSAKGTGFVNILPDEDGVVRRALLMVKHKGKLYPSISLRLACDQLGVKYEDIKVLPGKYLELPLEGGPVRIPIDESCQMIINYAGSSRVLSPIAFSYYNILLSYEQMANGQEPVIPMDKLKDKIVLIGNVSTGTTDISPIPFDRAYPMVGAHIAILDTILNRDFITPTPVFTDILMLVIIGLLMGLIIPRLRPFTSILFTLVLFISYLGINYFVFVKYGISLKIIPPPLLIFLCDLSLVIYRYTTEEKEKKYIKNIFSTYITPSVVTQILKNPDSLKLGGERREMTVYFSDIAGFTTVSESLSPEELVHLMNEYLEAMTLIIFKHQGTLDKYEGDAIMAFWNAPTDQPNHALWCCQAALECLEKLKSLREKWAAEGRPVLDMRIGINTGLMIVGNMGSSVRMDYTVMGDSVNLGARLESANKAYGSKIMMSEFTLEKVKEGIDYRELDALKVKGKNKPVHVYEVMAIKGNLSEQQQELLGVYNSALQCYKNKEWKEGIELFSRALEIIPDDGPSQTYLTRCREYLANPPAEDWNGVWELKTK